MDEVVVVGISSPFWVFCFPPTMMSDGMVRRKWGSRVVEQVDLVALGGREALFYTVYIFSTSSLDGLFSTTPALCHRLLGRVLLYLSSYTEFFFPSCTQFLFSAHSPSLPNPSQCSPWTPLCTHSGALRRHFWSFGSSAIFCWSRSHLPRVPYRSFPQVPPRQEATYSVFSR